jgi:mRNA interferase RelE/StbE
MSEWEISFTHTAHQDINRLHSGTRLRVIEKLRWFQEHMDEMVPLPLTAQWKGFFKLRIGDWRVVYRVDTASRGIVIHCVDRRDKIYKKNS